MAAVKPAIRAPGQSVYQVVSGLERKTIEMHDRRAVWHVVSILVRKEKQFRRRSHPHAAKSNHNATEPMPFFEENFPLIESPVPVLVGENENSVAVRRFPFWIRKDFDHPNPPAIVEVECNRLHHVRLARK